MITVKSFVFNPFQENTYVLYDQTGECIIVDAGCYNAHEQHELDNFIRNKNLKPVRQIITHGHVDHVVGVGYVLEKYGLEPESHPDDVELVSRAVEQGIMFGFKISQPPVLKKFLTPKDTVTFGQSSLSVLLVPGHSPGSIALYCKADQFVIVGDVLFRDTIGRTDLPGGSYEQLVDSINNEIIPLGDDTTVYCGHGPSTTIGFERKNNAFL
jgi:hydroxyacylglutathione hydrolase